MEFSRKVRENLLVKSGRRCCLCGKFRGTKILVHHIIPEASGGSNKESNGSRSASTAMLTLRPTTPTIL